MTYDQVYKKIENNVARIVFKNAEKFNADIISAWAVDTGYSKLAWSISRPSKIETKVSNHANYSGILFVGRVGNRGSLQMPNGGYPILKASILKLKQDLKQNTL